MYKFNEYVFNVLNESVSFPPEELKERIRGDKRISGILKKGLTFGQLEDPVGFFRTIKSIFLNNREIIQYEKDTASFNYWGWYFRKLRMVRPEEFNGTYFDMLVEVLGDFFKQVSCREKQYISTDLKKTLEDWINTSGSSRRKLSTSEIAELDSVPGLKPETAVKLYRGMMWEEYDMKMGRKGRKFIESIRDGSGIVDYTTERPESWTYSKEIADRFATARPATSQYSSMMNWLTSAGGAIQGELGVIVMVLARPEDVLTDLSLVKNKLKTQYVWEDEVIMKPGSYRLKIVTLYDKKGELTPQEFLDRIGAAGVSEREDIIKEFREDFVPGMMDTVKESRKYPKGGYLREEGILINEEAIAFYLQNENEIKRIGGELLGWFRKMDVLNNPPVMGFSSSDNETFLYEYLKMFYAIDTPDKNNRKEFYRFGSVEELIESLKLTKKDYGRLKKIIGNCLKSVDKIKRDIDNYRTDTIERLLGETLTPILEIHDFDRGMDSYETFMNIYNRIYPLILLVRLLGRVEYVTTSK
jgi:hypothetical protein